MHKKLLRECHVSTARVTVTSLTSGISIFSGLDPICSYPCVQNSYKVPCLFCFFPFYLALLLIYLFPVSLPSLLCFQWRLRAARPEFDSLKMQRFLLSSTVLRQTIGTVQFIHSVHGKLWRRYRAQGLNLILHPVTKVTNVWSFTSTLVTSKQPHGSYQYVYSLFDYIKQF